MRLSDVGRVHFVGIGGVGMSAIAKVLMERAIPVSGSDIKRSRTATLLEAMGADVHIGHSAGNVDGAGLVVVSSAIPGGNPELIRAGELNLPIMARGEALAALLGEQSSIVVAGTHGKTTTTSMIVTVLHRAGDDPTYLIGGGLNDAGTNAKHGRGEFAVAESDESDGSFLLLNPEIAVLTNVEVDHVDYWASLEDLYSGFEQFLDRVRPAGTVIVPADDPVLRRLADASGRAVVTFDGDGSVRARDIELDGQGARFVVETSAGRASVTLPVPGRHNVSNALAAAAACERAGLTLDDIARGLSAYRGVERRFQTRGRAGGVTIIDDYAHHPTEVRATLAAARPGPWDRVVAVFQPHRYSRTAAFALDFGPAFSDADRVVVTDVYGAGEEPVPGITGKLVADSVCTALPGRPVAYLPHRDELIGYLSASVRPGDALVTLGAGDISSVGEELLARLGER